MAVLESRLGGLGAALSAEVAELADRVRAGVVVVSAGSGGHGSGVIWQEDGVVLTNHHVVSGDEAEVSLADGRSFPAMVFRRDPERDLAALRVPAGGLPVVPLGDSRALRAGELILAVGNPLGLRGAVSVGIVSGVPREVWVGGRRLPEMVQADVDLYPGNSGGPLVDARGRVVGINSMVTGPGMALAIPSHVAEAFLGEAAVPRAFLGVMARQVDLPEAFTLHSGLGARRGLLVYGVAAGGPAERAGLLPGDVLIGVEGKLVDAPEELSGRLAAVGPDRPARLALLRGGRLRQAVVSAEWRNY